MTSIKLFTLQKITSLVIGIAGVLGVSIMISSKIFELNFNSWAAGIFPALLINLYHYFVLKKQFFRIYKESIEWKFPAMKTEGKIVFKSKNPSFSVNWKEITFYDESEVHELSLDGLWEKDRLKIQTTLKEYFNFVSN